MVIWEKRVILLLMYLMLFLRKGVIEMLCHWNNAS